MRSLLLLLAVLFSIHVLGQTKSPDEFGAKQVKVPFEKDSVDVLVFSKKGDELTPKPLLFFCQGSLPIPLLIYEGDVHYPTLPFDTKMLTEKYHLAIASKPGIPLIASSGELQQDLSFTDRISRLPPTKYVENNYLEYYVQRNIAIIEYFKTKKYIDKGSLVVAGHSQGARIAFEMALQSKSISQLIYASGNPCGQIMSMISATRQRENPFDTISYAENDFKYFEAIVSDSNNVDNPNGDTFKSIYSFSKSSLNDFPKLTIPVFICYGTVDPITPFNDLLRTEIIKQRKNNFTFKSYVGLDHNYFGMKENGQVDYEKYNWNSVAEDWMKWLNANSH